jgi:HlyD family secretion protein
MKLLRSILGVVVLLGIALLALWLLQRPSSTPILVSGTIETDEVRLASRYGGRITAIHGREGDTIPAGTVLVELEATELQAQRAQAAARLEELAQGPRTNEIAAARHEWESLQADLAQALRDAARASALWDEHTISAEERDQAVARVDILRERVAAAKARFELLAEGTRAEQIAQAKAHLAEIDAHLREMSIAAPTNSTTGYILEVLPVKVGDVAGPNREVATLLTTDHPWVRVYVPEPWLGHIAIDDAVKVSVDGFPDTNFTGTVDQIHRQAEFTPRNVQTVAERVRQVFGVKVRLPADERLRPGMAADVIFPRIPESLRNSTD